MEKCVTDWHMWQGKAKKIKIYVGGRRFFHPPLRISNGIALMKCIVMIFPALSYYEASHYMKAREKVKEFLGKLRQWP